MMRHRSLQSSLDRAAIPQGRSDRIAAGSGDSRARRDLIRWLLLVPLLLLLIFGCGSMAMMGTGTAYADTRSLLSADYNPWPFTVFSPVDPDIIHDVVRDQHRYPETFVEPVLPTVVPASFWPTPTPTASPTPLPTGLPGPSPTLTTTTVGTASATALPSPSLTAPISPTASETASPTLTATASATPSGPPPPVPPAVPPSNSYWFYDDAMPLSYMMFTAPPSGNYRSGSGAAFHSPGFALGQSIAAGVTTANFYANNPSGLPAMFTIELRAGAALLGSGTFALPANTFSANFFSASFSTGTHAFAAGERLQLSFSLPAPAQIYWDGAYNFSGVSVPAVGLLPSSTPTASSTVMPSRTPTPTGTFAATNTLVPTATNTLVPTATNTLVPTATNTLVPTATNTLVPTATNTLVPTATNTLVPTATNTLPPTVAPSPTPTPAGGPIVNYRSIGTNTGVLYASGNASIVAGTTTVTFGGGASLPAYVGVGDRLVIGLETFFILSRDSATQVTVQTPAVGTHTNSVYAIYRAYNTLQSWETDRQGDLVGGNRREVGVVYNDGPLTSGVTIGGSITDSTRYMQLTVAQGQRHSGTGGTGAVLDGEGTPLDAIYIDNDYTRVEWLELTRHRGQNAYGAIVVRAANVLISNVVIYDYDDATYNVHGIRISGAGGRSFTVRNCVIYDGDSTGIQGDELTDIGIIENCTIYGMIGQGIWEDQSTFTVRNTISMGNGGPDFNVTNGTLAYSMSEDATASCATCLNTKNPSSQFVSLTAGSENLHLKDGADAIDAATTLAGFSDDIDGDSRPQGAAWDMGADEYVGPVATSTPTPSATVPTPTNTPIPTATPTATSAASAPALDAVSNGRTGVSSLTISHTTSGSDRLMLVGVSINNDNNETVTSVAYSGIALTRVGFVAQADDARVEIWRLIAPPLGTHDVVITFSAQLWRSATAGVMTFTGVHQTIPLGTFVSNSATSSPGPATVDVASAANELVFDTVACELCASLTVGAGQTQRWNLSAENGSIRGAGSTEPGAATVTMSWSLGAANDWAIGAVPIRPSGGSPPAVDASSNTTSTVNSLTISHTTSGTNRLMLVGVSLNPQSGETVSSITYNGVALTFVGSATYANDARVEIWRLIAPTTGTHNLVINFSANLTYGAVAGVSTFTGVNQATPLGTFVGANGSSAGPATVSVTSAANELVFDTVACETCTSLTVGAGQTQRWNLSQAGDSVMGAGSTEPGAATVTMSWTLGSSDYWAIGAVPIRPN